MVETGTGLRGIRFTATHTPRVPHIGRALFDFVIVLVAAALRRRLLYLQ